MQWPGEQKQPHFLRRMVWQAGNPAFNGRHQPLASKWQMIDNSKEESRMIATGMGTGHRSCVTSRIGGR
jgi:hypothetical protein